MLRLKLCKNCVYILLYIALHFCDLTFYAIKNYRFFFNFTRLRYIFKMINSLLVSFHIQITNHQTLKKLFREIKFRINSVLNINKGYNLKGNIYENFNPLIYLIDVKTLHIII